MVEVPPIPAGLVLPPQEAQLRATLLGQGGPLASAMRAVEARPWRDSRWLATCWLWVQCLVVVRGFRGATTVADYVEAVARFMGWAEEAGHDFREITVRELDDWQKWLYVKRRLSASARRSALMAVRSLYSYLATRGEGSDVTKGYKAPKRVSTQAKKYSPTQLKALFSAVKQGHTELVVQRDRAILLLLLAAGLRREEIAGLRVDQLDLASERKGQVHVFGKGSKERTVPIEGPVVRELLRWLEARSRVPELCTDSVFVNLSRGGRPGLCIKGGPVTVKAIEDVVKRTARRAGLGSWGVHRFRVTFATMLYDDGTDIERTEAAIVVQRKRRAIQRDPREDDYTAREVASLLGHDPTTVTRWIHLGMLAAERDPTHQPTPDGRAPWRVTNQALRNFIITHAIHVDLRKLPAGHTPWFVDLLAGSRAHG